MDILLYLAKLVQNRKEVGILGIGTFYKKKSPGRYDIETHSFLPPSFTLQFKPEVTEQVVLAEYIHQERHISIDSANYFIEQFVEELQNQLQKQQKADLGEIGTLVLADDILSFEPNAVSGIEFYGLPQVKEDAAFEAPKEEDAATEKKEEIPATAVEASAVTKGEEPAKERLVFIEQAEEAVEEEISDDPAQEQPSIDASATPHIQQASPVEENAVYIEQVEEEISNEIPAEDSYETVADKPLNNAHEESTTASYAERPEDNVPVVSVEEVPVDTQKSNLESVTAETLREEENPGDVLNFVIDESNPAKEDENFYTATDEEIPQKKSSVYLKVILGTLILLIIFFVVYLLYPDTIDRIKNYYNHTEQKNGLALKKIPVPVPADTLVQKTDSVKPDTLKPDQIKKTEPKLLVTNPIVVKDTASTTYEIIGSSLYSLKEAEQFIRDMKARHGITAKIVSHEKGRKIKISIATFKTKAAADAQLPALEKKLNIKGLYTFLNTHKPE